MIEAVNLTKFYGGHAAVRKLSFKADKGKVLGFLGPNGAGKSTTMNMLTGYISATEGSVFVNGIDMFEEPERAKKDIGYLPELPPVYPDMTVGEYLRFVAELKKVPSKERTKMLEEIKERTEIKEVEGRLIKHLSKGYKQRVGLAGALVGYPEILILDEPTVGLDPKQIIEMRQLIRELAQDHTIILSSHILSEISAVCDEVMIINKGKLVAEGTPESLTAKMGEATEIIIDVPASAEGVEELLTAGIEGITGYQSLEAAEDEVRTFSLAEEPGTDAREKVFFAFAEKNIPLYRLLRPVKSLEDIFIEITDVKEPEPLGKAGKNPVMRLAENEETKASEEKTDSEMQEETDNQPVEEHPTAEETKEEGREE